MPDTQSASSSRVEWSTIWAGAAIATAVALVLLSFGASLGLGFASPYPDANASPIAFAIAAGIFLLIVDAISFYFGGYVTARLRARDPSASDHETDVRDGLHGLVMWSIGVVAAGVIALAGIGGIGVAAHAPPMVAGSVASVASQSINQAAASEQETDANASDASQDQRRADILRKLSIISGFVTAASLLAGAAAAFFGAHKGGEHRDKNITWAFFTSHVRAPPAR